jgi:hypothetical protein
LDLSSISTLKLLLILLLLPKFLFFGSFKETTSFPSSSYIFLSFFLPFLFNKSLSLLVPVEIEKLEWELRIREIKEDTEVIEEELLLLLLSEEEEG